VFIKELSSVVKEIKAKEPQLSIPVNVKKLQDHAKAIKSSVRKISNFLNFPKEEFINSPLFIDRARYFSVVLIDSSLWICRHILRKTNYLPVVYNKNPVCDFCNYSKIVGDKQDANTKLIPQILKQPQYLG